MKWKYVHAEELMGETWLKSKILLMSEFLYLINKYLCTSCCFKYCILLMIIYAVVRIYLPVVWHLTDWVGGS